MRNSRGKTSVIFLLLIIVIVITIGVIIMVSLRTDPIAENMKTDQVIKILFVLNDGEKHALTTDVFIYYPKSQKGALFDILGNTGAIYESLVAPDGRSGRVDRIDAVYTERGIDVYRSEIEKLTGLTIPFSIEISLDNFGLLTDLLGGMKIFVPSPVDASGSNGERWLLPSGAVTLDGEKIKTYVQYILPDETDGDQEDRRQNVMIALLVAIKDNRTVMFNKKNFPMFASKLSGNTDSDGMYKLLENISNVDSERLSPQTITGSIRIVDNKKLLFPYYDGQLIKDVVKQTTNSLVSKNATMQSRVYVVDIKNGTPTQGLARNTSALLNSAGYKVLGTSNADKSDYEKTIIINHIGNQEVAKALGDFINCTNIQEEAVKPESAGVDSAADVDFTIIIGKDFDGRYVRSTSKEETESEQPAKDAGRAE
jgi:anionic cell wall polymer biosynthesis LytR-Cps2A-Psr (LCP) family protein